MHLLHTLKRKHPADGPAKALEGAPFKLKVDGGLLPFTGTAPSVGSWAPYLVSFSCLSGKTAPILYCEYKYRFHY